METVGKVILYAVALNLLWQLGVLIKDVLNERHLVRKKSRLLSFYRGQKFKTKSGVELEFYELYSKKVRTIGSTGNIEELFLADDFVVGFYPDGNCEVVVKVKDLCV